MRTSSPELYAKVQTRGGVIDDPGYSSYQGRRVFFLKYVQVLF